MRSEPQLREILEQLLDQVLEPRILSLVESGEIETQADFDDALLPVVALRGTIDEWESDLKTALRYEYMPLESQDGTGDFSNAAERQAWLAEVCDQLEVTGDARTTRQHGFGGRLPQSTRGLGRHDLAA